MIYTCKICGRALDSDQEDVHLIPREDGAGHDAYCAHCWSEWGMFCSKYGLEVIKDDEDK